MTRQVLETNTSAPEAIRTALLLGLVVGESEDFAEADLPVCEECGAQIDKLREQVFGQRAAEGEAQAEAQEPAQET